MKLFPSNLTLSIKVRKFYRNNNNNNNNKKKKKQAADATRRSLRFQLKQRSKEGGTRAQKE